MSRYIPRTAIERESTMQVLRRANGLKTGDYVRYPDADKGPYVIKKSKLENPLFAEALAFIKTQGEAELAALQSAHDTAASLAKKD
jgi:hypothetical protein